MTLASHHSIVPVVVVVVAGNECLDTFQLYKKICEERDDDLEGFEKKTDTQTPPSSFKVIQD